MNGSRTTVGRVESAVAVALSASRRNEVVKPLPATRGGDVSENPLVRGHRLESKITLH
jgi:hypothetical protein